MLQAFSRENMKIAGHVVQEILHQGKNFTVYRSIKENETAPCILKVLDKKTTHKLKITQTLKNEYHFLEQIDSEYVIKAFDWIEDKDRAVIVLEDINGIPLKDEIKKQGFSFKLEPFIELALQMANGLAAIHGQNIIHKDINPTNIIWNSRTNSLKIIDFNIASKFDTKTSYLGNPEKLQGTLPYISPEQTGRVNRRVDMRSDLYSVGVTFYEMLTGQLPFEHRDPMEIVYAHLARDPEPPHIVNEQVPQVLSKIVLKLLQKNPEERYQSAKGLKYDLEKAVQLNFKDYKLGENDFSGKLQIPEKLYGREQEIEQLLDAYRRVSKGTKEMVLVAGYSGTGKTALVNEIHKPITKDRGYFISGKFDQLQRTVPYFAFIQALNQFCQLLLTEPQEILAQWKERILQAVGKLGKVLTDIIPQLESIIGQQPEVPELGGEEAQKRLNYVFQCFFQAVSTRKHPLVMFIDDLQWTDLASLNLLQVLIEDTQNHYFLFIGAYRDNEVSPTHPFMMTLEEIRKQERLIHTIPVKNLTIENVQEWLQDTLKTASHRDVSNIAYLIYQKTQGNAFFNIQFLENLYRENLLRFDFKQSGWTWDITEIQKQNITDNVVDLLARKIQALSIEVQDVLKLAACIGNAFYLRTLSVISQASKKKQERALEIALGEYLICPLGNEAYKFVHDRIHQAAYTLIAGNEKKKLHLEIGRLLLKDFRLSRASTGSKEVEQHLFDIVNQLNIGIDLIEIQEEKLELIGFNLEASRQARRSGAYTHGSEYVQKAMHLLPADCWQQHYDLTLAIYNEAIQISYLCGNYEEMENFVEVLFKFTPNITDKAIAYEYRMVSFIAQNKPHLAEGTFLDAFHNLGIDVPVEPGEEQTMSLLAEVQRILKSKGMDHLTRLPLASDPQKELVVRLFANGGVTAIIHSSQNMFPFIVGKTVELTLKHGLSREFPFIFACYGIIRNLMEDIPDAYQVGKISLDLLDIIPDTDTNQPKTMTAACLYLLNWKEHYKQVSRRLKKNYQDALNVGDVEFAAYSIEYSALYLTRTDTELNDLKNTLEAARKAAIQLKQLLLVSFLIVENHVISDLLGSRSKPVFLDIELESLTKDMPEGVAQLVVYDIYIRKVFFGYLFDDYTHILDHIFQAENIWKTITIPIGFLKSDLYFYTPLVYLQLYTRTAGGDEKKEYLAKAIKHMETLGKWADFGPVNFLHKYYLMQAELYRVTGQTHEAAEYYDKAIEKAFENEYINEAALANELAAKFYMQQNRHKLAALYLLEARDCYRKWGALAKVKHLEENYPRYLSIGVPGAKLTGTGTITSASTDTTDELLDVKSIIKSSQTLSSEVQLTRLLEKMMQILVENAGAQKSMLIENIDTRLLIQAEGTADGVSGILQRQPVEESGNVPLS
ncbi:MAG: serine/threonine-protein kinase PknK, partial [Candidatus Aminicenantes bacterium]